MEVPFVDLRAQYRTINKEIDRAIERVLKDVSFIGGSIVEDFEDAFAKFLTINHVVGCANGTDALEIALEALDIGKGDEVLVPASTWISTASAVVRVGAMPVFIDVHPEYYSIDPAKIEEKLTKRTKAIIPVHFYGLPALMPEIITFARKYKLKIIEDCAQAHGAMINDQKVGTFGDIATFSFFPSKNLGAYGDGGAIATQNDNLARKCRIISKLGQDGKHNHVAIGRNSRLDTLQAAILLAKLPHLHEWTAKRRYVARQYNIAFRDMNITLQRIPTDYKHVYHLYVIQTKHRDKLKEYLKQQDIKTQVHYPHPVTSLAPFTSSGKFPVAENIADQILSLPMYPEISEDKIKFVIGQIKTFLKYKVN